MKNSSIILNYYMIHLSFSDVFNRKNWATYYGNTYERVRKYP